MSKKEQSLDDLLASDSLESVTFTRKQLIAFRARAVAEGRAQAAAEKAGGLSEHDQGIIRDLKAMAAQRDNGFWPQALAMGALRIIERDSKSPAADAGDLSCTEPNRANCPRHCEDFCNKEESQRNLKTWPERIYLQSEDEFGTGTCTFEAQHEITWAQDQISAHDVEYVRADTVARPAAVMAGGLVPDAACKQGKCACPTTGCWGQCSLARNPVIISNGGA